MPILFSKNPLACLIRAGRLDDGGLILAIVAAPSHLRERGLQLPEKTEALLRACLSGPQRQTRESSWRFQRLYELALVRPCSGAWAITPQGRRHLLTSPAPALSPASAPA